MGRDTTSQSWQLWRGAGQDAWHSPLCVSGDDALKLSHFQNHVSAESLHPIVFCSLHQARVILKSLPRNISVFLLLGFLLLNSKSDQEILKHSATTGGMIKLKGDLQTHSLSLRPSAPFSVALKARGWPMRREYCQHWPMRGRVLRVCRSLRSCGCLWRTGWRSGTPSTTPGSTITRRQVLTWSHDHIISWFRISIYR